MSTATHAWDQHNQLLDQVQFTDREIAFWQARQQHALVALAAEPVPMSMSEADQLRWVEHEVGAALHVHPNTAGNWIALARELVCQLPGVLRLLEAGEITLRHARAAVEALLPLTPAQKTAVQDDVLPEAAGMSVTEFAAALSKAVHRITPAQIEDRRQNEIDERGVRLSATRNGTVTLIARGLDPVDATTVLNRLNSVADTYAALDAAACHSAALDVAACHPDGCHGAGLDTPGLRTARTDTPPRDPADADAPPDNAAGNDTPPGDPGNTDTLGNGQGAAAAPVCRTADQRRADALIALATTTPITATPITATPTTATPATGTRGAGSGFGRAPIAVNVCIALSTLLGLDQQPGEITAPGFPPGSPITAAHARLLAFEEKSTWRRLVTDPLGQLIDYGRTTYRPPAALARHVTARDRTCRGLHCNRQASTCDLDHHRDWNHGGHTNQRNLGPLHTPAPHQAHQQLAHRTPRQRQPPVDHHTRTHLHQESGHLPHRPNQQPRQRRTAVLGSRSPGASRDKVDSAIGVAVGMSASAGPDYGPEVADLGNHWPIDTDCQREDVACPLS